LVIKNPFTLSRDPEVEHLHAARLRAHQVVALDVAMQEAVGVRRAKCVGGKRARDQRFVRRELAD